MKLINYLVRELVYTAQMQSPTQPGHACTFEGGKACGWQNDARDDFDWVMRPGTIFKPGIGAPYDHTFGTSGQKGCDKYWFFFKFVHAR